MPKVSASIISANFVKLGSEINALTQAGADFIHIDVMDGLFVPNITLGIKAVQDIAATSKLPLDVHLMIQDPERYVEAFANAGSNIITIHAEATKITKKALEIIKKCNVKSGLALKPETSETVIEPFYEQLDWILVMSVNPGFSGQKFLHSQIAKIANIKKRVKALNKQIAIAVDGGINCDTAALAVAAGCDVLVAGSYIFASQDYAASIARLKGAANPS